MKRLERYIKVKKLFILLFSFSLLFFTSSFSAVAQDASESSDSVRDKVRETIENLVKKPRAVVGTLDGITDSTLKIKSETEKLTQVATNKDTVYVKYTKGKSQEAKFSDLAIGDFVAALGFKNGNDIIDVQRVLAYGEAPYVKKQAVRGTVEAITKGVITLKATRDTWSVETTKNTEIKSKNEELVMGDIEKGDQVIAVGEINLKKENTISASKIRVISDKVEITPSPKATPKVSPKPTPKPSPSATTAP